ncbi:MAG: glycosyltransferase family A protein [Blastomonas sp.]
MTKLSVVLPVHNALPYLDAAVESILQQDFKDFVLIVRDDASTDGSGERLQYWAERDERIKLYRGTEQLGPVGSSNWVTRKAETSLIARMDADDLAAPDWLSREYAIMCEHPDVVLTGSFYNTIDHFGRQVRPPERWRMVRRSVYSPFSHSSILFRREIFEAIGGYREAAAYWEDYDLYVRFAERGRVAVICLPLNSVRQGQTSTRLVSDRAEVEKSVNLAYICIDSYVAGKDYSPLLDRADEIKRDAPLRPETLVAYAANQLWAGQSPRVFSRMIREAKLTFSLVTLQCLLWALWCQISPGSLRYLLRKLVLFRNKVFGRHIKDGQIYEWDPRSMGRSGLLQPAGTGKTGEQR